VLDVVVTDGLSGIGGGGSVAVSRVRIDEVILRLVTGGSVVSAQTSNHDSK
jgi:hypothetical protein